MASLYEQHPSTEGLLHMPHQSRGQAGNHYSLNYPVAGAALGSESVINLQSVPMVVDSAYLVFDQAAVAVNTNPGLVQTPFYISSQGIRLSYNDSTVYTMSAENCYCYPLIYADSAGQVNRHLNMINEGADPANDAVDQANDAAGVRFINLQPIVDAWLSNIGSLSAYPSGKWQLHVPFAGATSIRTSSSGSPTGGAISNLNLVLAGHSEDEGNSARIADALSKRGLEFTFLQPVQFSQTYDASATSAQVLMNSLQGDLDHMVEMKRVTASLTSTTAATICRTEWKNYSAAGDTVGFGTSSNPTYLLGRNVSQHQLRLAGYGDYGVYGNSYLTRGASPKVVDTSISVISCSENPKMDQEHGMYSGSIRVFNDWQANYAFSSTVTADTITIICFMRKRARLNYAGAEIMDE